MSDWDGSPVEIKVSGYPVRVDEDPFHQIQKLSAMRPHIRYPFHVTRRDQVRWREIDPGWYGHAFRVWKWDVRAKPMKRPPPPPGSPIIGDPRAVEHHGYMPNVPDRALLNFGCPACDAGAYTMRFCEMCGGTGTLTPREN